MKKTIQWMLIVVFCGFIGGLTVLNCFNETRDFSEQENRTLAQFPEFSWDRFFFDHYTIDLEEWFTDQFVARDQWVGIKALSERAAGKIENQNVYFGKEDWLIGQVDILSDQRSLSNIRKINAFAANTGIPVTMMLVPSAAQTYPEMLPGLAYNTDQDEVIRQISEKTENIQMVSVSDRLKDHQDQIYYFTTDHHWNALGAYQGYKALMEAWNMEAMEPGRDFDYQLSAEGFKGTQYSRSGAYWHTGDPVLTWTYREPFDVTVRQDQKEETTDSLFSWSRLEEKDKYMVYLDGNHAVTEIHSSTDSKEKLLVIKDSYAHILVPYLAPHFSDITMVDLRYYRFPVSELAEQMEADRILILYSVPDFCEDTGLALLK